MSKYGDKTENGDIRYLTYYFEDCKTMYDVIPHGSKESSTLRTKFHLSFAKVNNYYLSTTVDGKCIGNINAARNGVDWINFEVVLRRSKRFADGLLQLDLKPQSTFGIYSVNSSEYTMAEYSCYRHSIIVIPIYETLGSNVCAFISKQGINFIFVLLSF